MTFPGRLPWPHWLDGQRRRPRRIRAPSLPVSNHPGHAPRQPGWPAGWGWPGRGTGWRPAARPRRCGRGRSACGHDNGCGFRRGRDLPGVRGGESLDVGPGQGGRRRAASRRVGRHGRRVCSPTLRPHARADPDAESVHSLLKISIFGGYGSRFEPGLSEEAVDESGSVLHPF